MRRLLALSCIVAVWMLLPIPAQATWVSTNCADDHYADTTLKRTDARAYAEVGVHEGYEWNGGCWNNDNTDNTPSNGEGTNDGGEGPDCVGFTFKAWELLPNPDSTGFRHYSKLQNINGPYDSPDFQYPETGWQFYHVAKGSNNDNKNILYMDALAKNGHVAMIYTVESGTNYDWVIHAVGQGSGHDPVDIMEEDYWANSDYRGVRRDLWTPECYPHCTSMSTEASEVVIVP
jgi:hypothetical protein